MKPEIITSRQNPLLQHVRKLLSSRSYREQTREFVAEGGKMLTEAVKWQAEVTTVVFSEQCPMLPDTDARLVQVPRDVLASVSDVECTQGVLFICKTSLPETARLPATCLVLDGLQDPGNVGTILRTADAFDVPVVLSDGCADLYNPKTVRATMGAVFRANILRMTKAEILRQCREDSVPLAVTALSEQSEDIRQAKLVGAVVIGSEGSGVCREFTEAADKKLIIPMSSRCESLNAAIAAALVLWEMRR